MIGAVASKELPLAAPPVRVPWLLQRSCRFPRSRRSVCSQLLNESDQVFLVLARMRGVAAVLFASGVSSSYCLPAYQSIGLPLLSSHGAADHVVSCVWLTWPRLGDLSLAAASTRRVLHTSISLEKSNMSNFNPYTPTSDFPLDGSMAEKISVQPIDLLKRAYALMGDQYWLFVGMSLVVFLLGSMVPFGIIMAPLLVGLFMCFIHREQGRQVEFGMVFKGFDLFMNSFLVMLIMVAASVIVMIPLIIILMATLFAMMPPQNAAPSPMLFVLLAFIYMAIIFVSLAIYIPFFFTFPLIADRGLSAGDAIRASWRGAKSNLLGVIWFMVVVTAVSIPCAMCCYFPLFLLMPIAVGGHYLLYRDIYGSRPIELI